MGVELFIPGTKREEILISTPAENVEGRSRRWQAEEWSQQKGGRKVSRIGPAPPVRLYFDLFWKLLVCAQESERATKLERRALERERTERMLESCSLEVEEYRRIASDVNYI
jgi:hypothetical protein